MGLQLGKTIQHKACFMKPSITREGCTVYRWLVRAKTKIHSTVSTERISLLHHHQVGKSLS